MLVLALLCAGVLPDDTAAAQVSRGIVIEPAPVYLLPDPTRTPLRTLPVNTEVRVLTQKGNWLRVEFEDPQFGLRVGYVEATKVRIYKSDSPAVEPAAPPATPQPGTPSQPRGSARPGLGLKGYGTYGGMAFAARETFEAVAGSRTFTNFGGGGTITNLWRNLFVDVGFARSEVDGERVFVNGTTVHTLGIPLQVTVTPVDVAAGWRVTQGRVSTFVGAGLTSLLYEESDAFSDPDEEVSERKTGALALVGVDVEVVRWVFVGGELRYRAVSSILGAGGASEAFGEDEAGGFSAGLRLSFGK